jgi:hypothetical protein
MKERTRRQRLGIMAGLLPNPMQDIVDNSRDDSSIFKELIHICRAAQGSYDVVKLAKDCDEIFARFVAVSFLRFLISDLSQISRENVSNAISFVGCVIRSRISIA